MKTRTSYLLVFSLFITLSTFAQSQNEREYRIRKIQFPEKALSYIKQEVNQAKQLRFYKEIDNDEVNYIAKFKKDRLRYSINFNKESTVENVKIAIKTIDIPDESLEKIQNYLKTHFKKYKIRRILQQYPVSNNSDVEKTVKNAFQNMLLPGINYELFVSGKNDKKFELHQALFNAGGEFKSIRKSLPPNYDHVLY